jgi:hypothetical protein
MIRTLIKRLKKKKNSRTMRKGKSYKNMCHQEKFKKKRKNRTLKMGCATLTQRQRSCPRFANSGYLVGDGAAKATRTSTTKKKTI